MRGRVAAAPPPAHDAGHPAAAAPGEPGELGAAEVPGGLQVSERGYTLALSAPTAAAGRSTVAFRILGGDGVTDGGIRGYTGKAGDWNERAGGSIGATRAGVGT